MVNVLCVQVTLAAHPISLRPAQVSDVRTPAGRAGLKEAISPPPHPLRVLSPDSLLGGHLSRCCTPAPHTLLLFQNLPGQIGASQCLHAYATIYAYTCEPMQAEVQVAPAPIPLRRSMPEEDEKTGRYWSAKILLMSGMPEKYALRLSCLHELIMRSLRQ